MTGTLRPIYLTVKEAAPIARRHTETITLALRLGELVGHQRSKGAAWRIREDNLVAWLEGEAA